MTVLDSRHSAVCGFGVCGEAICGATFDFYCTVETSIRKCEAEGIIRKCEGEGLIRNCNVETEVIEA